jgi:hypothetical protein
MQTSPRYIHDFLAHKLVWTSVIELQSIAFGGLFLATGMAVALSTISSSENPGQNILVSSQSFYRFCLSLMESFDARENDAMRSCPRDQNPIPLSDTNENLFFFEKTCNLWVFSIVREKSDFEQT